MNNFNYKKALLYSPPLLILILVLAYYLMNRNYLNRNQVTLNNIEPKKVIYSNDMAEVNNAFNNNDFVTANKILDEKLSNNNKDIETLLAKARTLAQEASITFKEKTLGDEAMIYIEQALKLDPKNVEALTLKGYVFEIQENYSKAHENYDAALSINPKSVETLAQKAHAKQLQGESTEAKKLYEQAYKIDRENPLVNLGLAKIYSNEGKLEQAKAMFLVAGDSNTNNRQRAEGYYSAALIAEAIMQKQKSYELAEIQDLANKAIAIDPDYAQSYVLLAKTQFLSSVNFKDVADKNKIIEASFRNIDVALKLNPNLAYAHLELVTQFFLLNQIKNVKLILGNMPKIIQKDISLNKNEKNNFLKIIENMSKQINNTK